MTNDEGREIWKKLLGLFTNAPDENGTVAWKEYLLEQDHAVCAGVLHQIRSGRVNSGEFFPTIATFNRWIIAKQRENSKAEKAREYAHNCRRCSGHTWLTDDPTGLVPCPECRPSSYTRWEDRLYAFGVLGPDDEKDGPKEAYEPARSPDTRTGPATSAERTKQWVQHLANPMRTTVYPEGDDDNPVVDEPATVAGTVDEQEEFNSIVQSLDSDWEGF